MVQVERLAVRVATGWPADLDKFFNLRVVHRQVARSRAATERALANGEGQ